MGSPGQVPFIFHLPTHSFIHSLVICSLVYLFVFLFTCLPVGLFVYLFIYSFTYLSIYLLFVNLFIYFITDTNPLSYLFYLLIYLFVHLFTSPPARQLINPFTYSFIWVSHSPSHLSNHSFYPTFIHSRIRANILEFAPIFSNSHLFFTFSGTLPSPQA